MYFGKVVELATTVLSCARAHPYTNLLTHLRAGDDIFAKQGGADLLSRRKVRFPRTLSKFC